jgi:uncharacterized membrane protein
VVDPDLHDFVDRTRIRAAIRSAESSTHAAIAVSISAHVDGDIHLAALRELHARKGARKRIHALFFVVPSRRAFAVVGDANAHERLGQGAWDAVAGVVQQHFRDGDPTAGLVAGVEELGRHLAHHFPRDDASKR